MTEGFGLEVDGRMKAVFPSQEEAQKSAENLKARYPLLQVKVYDAAAHTRRNCQQEKQLSPSTNNIRMNCVAP